MPKYPSPLFRFAERKECMREAERLLTSPRVCCINCRQKLINMVDPKTGNTAAHVSIAHNNVYLFETFLYSGADLGIPNKAGVTAIELAFDIPEFRSALENYTTEKDGCRVVTVSADVARPLLELERLRYTLTVPADRRRITTLLSDCYDNNGLPFAAFRNRLSVEMYLKNGAIRPEHRLNCFIIIK